MWCTRHGSLQRPNVVCDQVPVELSDPEVEVRVHKLRDGLLVLHLFHSLIKRLDFPQGLPNSGQFPLHFALKAPRRSIHLLHVPHHNP